MASGGSKGDLRSQKLSSELDATIEATQQDGCEDVPDRFSQYLFREGETDQTVEMESEQTLEEGQDPYSQPGKSQTIIYIYYHGYVLHSGFIKAEFLCYNK